LQIGTEDGAWLDAIREFLYAKPKGRFPGFDTFGMARELAHSAIIAVTENRTVRLVLPFPVLM